MPANGYEWVKGEQVMSDNLRIPDDFLVKRPGPVKRVAFPDDLWVSFWNAFSVKRDARDRILSLAETYGQLHLAGQHFHRLDGNTEEGEPLFEWQLELQKFYDTFMLWEWVKGATERDVQRVRTYCEPFYQPKPGTCWRLAWPPNIHSLLSKPLSLAERVITLTINAQLAPELRATGKCEFPRCGFAPDWPDFSSQTRAILRGGDGRLQLAMVSTDLLKTVWLQLAAYVAGQRKAKKCEAPDCGLLMDVTDSPRPGARRMHPKCEERLRKRRYRDNKRKEGE